jgi:hypothetical protein
MSDTSGGGAPAIDFNRLRQEIEAAPRVSRRNNEDEDPVKYAPPIVRERAQAQGAPQRRVSALQNIARALLDLPWRDGEAMGKAIDAKRGSDGKTTTAALMDWAWEWETFKEEERPTSKD